jgi:hypothetical protein
MTLTQGRIPAEAIRATALRWREIAEVAPVVDLNKKQPTIDGRCAHWSEPMGANAVLTRDTGFASGAFAGFVGLFAAERAFHLNLDFRHTRNGMFRPHDHEVATMLVEGAFGDWLPLVLCQRQNPDRGRQRDAWHYLVFMAEGWHDPICGLRPEGYITWPQRMDMLAQQQRGTA